jgi:molybdenum cofactor cytidylyltransferase
MGQPKLLLPWRDSTVIEHLLAAWRDSRVDRIVVVVHPRDAGLADGCRTSGVDVVVPSAAPPEMKDSVACALEFLQAAESPDPSDAWLLAPADVPQLSSHVVDRLLDEYAALSSPLSILVPTSAGRRGHPVLFPWPMAAEIDELGNDEGVNALLQRHPVREIDCGASGVPDDLDTPDDYRRLRDV